MADFKFKVNKDMCYIILYSLFSYHVTSLHDIVSEAIKSLYSDLVFIASVCHSHPLK